MNSITLELTIEQVNLVLGALGNMPYLQVQSIIEEIRTQATPQVSQQPAESEE